MREKAEQLLRHMLGDDVRFRAGQGEAIHALVEERARVLVVQKTGWGKSIVYFIAAKLIRDQGGGPALLISPLLSLMRNQLEMAARVGIRAASINSANSTEWNDVEEELRRDRCDLLMVSPERLGSERFLSRTMPCVRRGIGLFVVDEAHCISDWGHDFRPDYRRIVRIVAALPSSVPVLATTATANDRVIADVQQQLGQKLRLLRGPLARESLRLQNVELAGEADRLAWLAHNVPHLSGSGIVYCLTVPDCERVAAWLRRCGVNAEAYHAGLDDGRRNQLEQQLLHNQVKALVATVALGMGFDKPDLGFVVHYQRPGSVVAYYQQIGRAGRALSNAPVVLLHGGTEDDRIQEYFIQSAFPTAEESRGVVDALAKCHGLRYSELLREVDITSARLEKALKLLEMDGAIARDNRAYFRTPNPWKPDAERAHRITGLRRAELQRMHEYVASRTCLLEFLERELDDPQAHACGKCAVCAGPFLPSGADPKLAAEAECFLCHADRPIEPRRMWPSPGVNSWKGRIASELCLAPGRALCAYGDAGWGEQVRAGKYQQHRLSDELVKAAADLIRQNWRPQPFPAWVTAIPSIRHPVLVANFGERLARALGVPYRMALRKTQNTAEQKLMHNSLHQVANLARAFEAVGCQVLAAPVLLVDDMVDSRWTMTVCGALLRQAGCEVVYPFALADSRGGGDTG